MLGTAYALAAAAAVVSLLTGGAQAHMIMKTPAPFGGSSLDNSPLTSNFPCKVTGDAAAFFDRSTTKPTVMGLGETQTLSFTGSAVHGGGSCQLAVTADKVPSKASKWQVILSLEGGCPSKDGSGPSEYDFKIPDQVQPGEYVFAWTWISKLAGQPEYYMNCAPITVTGGGGKKRDAAPSGSGGDTSSPSGALPDLFVANLASINSCRTTPGTDPVYPQAGPYVEKPGTKNNFAEITVKSGACTASGGGSDAPGSGNGNGNGGGGSDGNPSNGGSGSGGGSVAPGPGAGHGGSGSGSPNNGGGGGAGSAPPTTTTPAAAPAPTTLVSSTMTGTAPTAPAPTTGGGGLSGACGEEGVFNCVAGTSFQQCASGQWSALQAMPSGTKCKLGQSSTLWNRGEPRARAVRRMW